VPRIRIIRIRIAAESSSTYIISTIGRRGVGRAILEMPFPLSFLSKNSASFPADCPRVCVCGGVLLDALECCLVVEEPDEDVEVIEDCALITYGSPLDAAQRVYTNTIEKKAKQRTH
jgi:hypothetical protein